MSEQLTCVDCGSPFEFTDGEAEFYEQRGLFKPKRCKDCRNKKRLENGNKSWKRKKF